MILGTEAIGLLNIGADNATVYGPQRYTQSSTGSLKISISEYVNNLYNELTSFEEDTTASLKITGGYIGDWGYVYTEPTTANLQISGISSLGFVYTQISSPSLQISATYTTTSIQSDAQPFNLLASAQSKMAWYTYSLQEFEQKPVKLRLNGTSIDYYLTASEVGGDTPQIWIG
jgi:hypothetical protein